MALFSGRILKLGINPYVGIPKRVLWELFDRSGRTKGPIPVRGRLNGKEFVQTAVKYAGAWRLYLNTPMRRNAGIDVGDVAHVEIAFDPRPRTIPMHPKLKRALSDNTIARKTFRALTPSRQKEILRYIGSLKTEETLQRIIHSVIKMLSGRKQKTLSFLAGRTRRRP